MTPPPPSLPPIPGAALSRRRLLRLGGGLGAAAVFGGALSGCAGRADAEPVTSGRVRLAFWTHDQAYVDFFQAAADTAAATGGGPFAWELDATRTGAADIVTKTIAQTIAGRGTPDVVGLEIGAFPRLLRGDLAAEILEPLESYVTDAEDDLLTVRTAPFSQDGHLYALDSDAPLVVYYYRETEFERVGLPTDAGSWEELAEAALRVRRRHDVCVGAACVGSELGQVVQSFDQLLMQRGGRLFQEDGTPLDRDARGGGGAGVPGQGRPGGLSGHHPRPVRARHGRGVHLGPAHRPVRRDLVQGLRPDAQRARPGGRVAHPGAAGLRGRRLTRVVHRRHRLRRAARQGEHPRRRRADQDRLPHP
ncbi:extracellular solute-binding protein [Streptomyces radicis]|uniref:extracellular solute-binding protein n=1 Tax=Streptomyces radicis TaxID=1750517 RepID=UPI001E3326F3|nr:extracellular solute-binding protein [Streptomyces radicis]